MPTTPSGKRMVIIMIILIRCGMICHSMVQYGMVTPRAAALTVAHPMVSAHRNANTDMCRVYRHGSKRYPTRMPSTNFSTDFTRR